MSDTQDALPAPWQQAVQTIREQPAPVESLRTLIDTVERWPAPRRRQTRSARVFALCSMAAGLLLAITWLAWPTDSWAQVVQAMQQKQWIRASHPASEIVTWFNPVRGITCTKSKHHAYFHDARLKVVYRYFTTDQTIYRVMESPEERATARSSALLFTSILENKTELDVGLLDRLEILRQERRDISSEGRKTTEYHLQCRIKDAPAHRLNMVLHVDPNTRLVQKLVMLNPNTISADEPRELQFTFDYPDAGPLDIYDLGLAKSTRFVDRVPSEDLHRMAEVIHDNRENFDSYHGIVLVGKTYPHAQIWRHGTKWRIEMQKGTSKDIKPPAILEDPAKWWLEQAKTLAWETFEVCDGDYIYKPDSKNYLPAERSIDKHSKTSASTMSGYAEKILPERIAYPIPGIGSHMHEVKLVPVTANDPPDTKHLLETLTTKQNSAAHRQDFWFDPTRRYIVIRHDIGEFDTQPEFKLWRQLEKLNRSPSGIWYPEQIKGTYGNYTYYLDFKAKMDDNLFEPKERKKER